LVNGTGYFAIGQDKLGD